MSTKFLSVKVFFKLNTLFRLIFEKLTTNWNVNSKNVLSPFLYFDRSSLFDILVHPSSLRPRNLSLFTIILHLGYLRTFFWFTILSNLWDFSIVVHCTSTIRNLVITLLKSDSTFCLFPAISPRRFMMFLIYLINESKVGCKIHKGLKP